MQQEIDQSWRLVAVEQVAKQLVLFRPDTGKARDRRKQRIEQSGAHRNLLAAQLVMRGIRTALHPHQKAGDCRVKPGNEDAVDNWGQVRADKPRSDRYISLARHVRAFGVGIRK